MLIKCTYILRAPFKSACARIAPPPDKEAVVHQCDFTYIML